MSDKGRPQWALASFEAGRYLRHPMTAIGVVFSLVLIWYCLDGAPVLLRDTVLLGGLLLPIAAATFLVAFQTTARIRRLEELPESLPMDRNRIVLGVQMALLAPILLTAVVEAGALIYLLAGDPIGSIPIWEALGPPAITAVGGMGGIFLGRYLPHPLTAPVAVIGLGVLEFIAAPDRRLGHETPTNNFEWLAPWIPPNAYEPLVVQEARPAALHLAYLLGLIVVMGLVVRRTTQAHNTGRLAIAGLFVATLIGISLNMVAIDPDFHNHWPTAAENETCRDIEGIEYCALPLYENWIPRWQTTVAAVNEVLPVQLNAVYQRPPQTGWDENSGVPEGPAVVLTTPEWDRPGGAPEQAFALALRAAQSAVALPAAPETRFLTEAEIETFVRENPGSNADMFRGTETYVHCSSIGQARAAIAFWAAATTLPGAEEMILDSLNRFTESPRYVHRGLSHLTGTSIGRSDARLALTLLSIPIVDVQRAVNENWSAVADGSLTSAELAAIFGLAPFPESQLDFPSPQCR